MIEGFDLLHVIYFGFQFEERALQAIFLNRYQLVVVLDKFRIEMHRLNVPRQVLGHLLHELVFELVQPGLNALLLGPLLVQLVI